MRSNTYRPLLIVYCSLLIVSLLAACGAPGATSTPVSPTPTPTPILYTVTPTPTQEPQPMIVPLRLWLPEELDPYGEQPGADVLAQQLTEFSRAYPDLRVDVTVKKAHGRGGLLDFLRAAREAAPSVVPDLMVLDVADLETLASSDLIQPLDSLLPPDKMTDRFPFAAELGTVEGATLEEVTTVGFVIGTDTQHLVYHPTLLSSPPLTWGQVISPPVSFLFPAGGHDQQVNDATLVQYLAAGGGLTTPEGNPRLDKEVLIGVLNFYSDCIGTGAISPTMVLNITSADQSWEQFKAGGGDIAVVPAGRYWLETSGDTPVETISTAAMIPTRDGDSFSIVQGGWAITMVASDPTRQELAIKLFDWLTDPERSAQWTQAAGYLPGTRSALRLWNLSDSERAVLRSVMESAVLLPPPKVMTVVGPVMQEAVEAVLQGRSTPNGAATTAVQQLER